MRFLKSETGSIYTKAVCFGGKIADLEPLEANVVDASQEKHVPVVEREGHKITVKVGSVEHPMSEEHYIQFIAIQMKKGYAVRQLSAGEAPEAFFCLDKNDEPVAVYAYCNLHGLWKTEL